MKNYLIIISCIFLLGCMKEDEIILQPYENTEQDTLILPTPPTTIDYYFTGSIDNVQYSLHSNSLDVVTSYGIAHFNCVSPSYSHIFTTALSYADTANKVKIRVDKSMLSFNGNSGISDAAFNLFFAPSSYPYNFLRAIGSKSSLLSL